MAMFDRLVQRASARGESIARDMLSRAGAAYSEVPGVTAVPNGAGLILEGKGLVKRWLRDPRLRFALRFRV